MKINNKIKEVMENQENFFREIDNYLKKHETEDDRWINLTNWMLSDNFVQKQVTQNVTAEQIVQRIIQNYADRVKHGPYMSRIERKITLQSLTEKEFEALQKEFASRGFRFTKTKYPIRDQLIKASKKLVKKERNKK